jgi:hypothetical protein
VQQWRKIQLLHLFPWPPCWCHRPWCGVKNTFGMSAYSKEYICPILLDSTSSDRNACLSDEYDVTRWVSNYHLGHSVGYVELPVRNRILDILSVQPELKLIPQGKRSVFISGPGTKQRATETVVHGGTPLLFTDGAALLWIEDMASNTDGVTWR